MSVGGLPSKSQEVSASVQATRADVVVQLGTPRVYARRLKQRYSTMFAPCPENLDIGGRPEGRYIYIELGKSPTIEILDDDNSPMKSLQLSLRKGDDGAELQIAASLDEENSAYEWWIEMTADLNDGTSEQYRIPAQGTFKVAGLPAEPRAAYSDLREPNTCQRKEPGCWFN